MKQRVLIARVPLVIISTLVAIGCSDGSDRDVPPTGKSRSALTSSAVDASAAIQSIQSLLPSAHVTTRAGRISRIYGTVITTGETPGASAQAFNDTFALALGAAPSELEPAGGQGGINGTGSGPSRVGLMVDRNTGQYKFWLYRYAQTRNGIPVYDSELRVLVRNTADNPVVWAASSLRDLGSFAVAPAATAARPSVDAVKSVQATRAIPDSSGGSLAAPTALTRFSEPEWVIFAGAGDQSVPPRLSVRYFGEGDNPPANWEFVADAATGDVLHAESLIHAVDVPGRVQGNVTPGVSAAECEADVTMPVPHADVSIVGGNASTTSSLGFFNLSNPGTAPVDVVSSLTGEFFDIVNAAGPTAELIQTVTPPNQAIFLHNAEGDDFERAQANAYVGINAARDFLLSYMPDYPTISTELGFPAEVNSLEPGLCPGNAWYFPFSQVLFCAPGFGITNTAFNSVVYHEFGHHIVQTGGSGQGEYGEGMSDTISVLITENPDLAPGFFLDDCDNPLRTADNDCQFLPPPQCSTCGSQIHACGQLLSGAVWSVRQQLMMTEPTEFRDILNVLTLNSIPMHIGTSIDAAIAIDFLTLDDDDGDINNGTPHGAEICAGFQAHGIDCPLAPPASPCSEFCANPEVISWSGSYQSGPLGTGEVCRETTQPVAGGNCGNFAGGRQLFVNGTQMPCNGGNWPSVPPAVNGGYCVQATPGNFSWAFFTLW